MHLLYIDGSGSVKNPDESHFVLAGIAVFERQIYHLINEFDDFVASLDLGDASEIELHGNPLLRGSERPWKGLQRKRREALLSDALGILRRSQRGVRAFGVVVNKKDRAPFDPVERAYEEICNRFNLFLKRIYAREGDKQRGLIIMDESHYEEALQGLAGQFRVNGTRWGDLRNLAEVPLFVNSRVCRLVQVADLVAYSLWRRYEHGDTRFLDVIVSKFDHEGGVMHGLVHDHRADREGCPCPACMSRVSRRQPELPHLAASQH